MAAAVSVRKLYTSPPISRRIDQRSAVTWNLKAISKVVDATNTLRPQRLSARRCWEYFSVRQVLKVRHAKLKEIRAALVAGGRDGLDAQASTSGLSRSTTWSVLKG